MSEIGTRKAPARDWRSRLAGSGPPGVLAFIVIFLGTITLSPLVGCVLVLVWARLARVPFSELGFVRPRSWITVLALGVVLGVGLKLLMKALVLPLLGAEAVNRHFHFVQGHPRAALGMAAYAFVAAFTEETFFRGYLFERIGAWLGKNAAGAAVALVVSSALFGLLHFQQGKLGIMNATIVGVATGAIYLANRRRLFLLMVLHATFDIVSMAIIYFGLEGSVARSLFPGM